MDVLNQENQFSETEKALRSVLERVYATSDLLVIGEVVDMVSSAFFINFDFLIYIKERKWFGDQVVGGAPDFLKFNFLSFEVQNGETRRFETLGLLDSREIELTNLGYTRSDKELCRVVFRLDSEGNTSIIVNLLARILVAFYKNCGSFDHFRESVSTRYIKEFYQKNEAPTAAQLIDYIESKSQLKCSLWHQKDEMYFRNPELEASELLDPFPESGSQLPTFHQDSEFLRSLTASVLRKNQTHGRPKNTSTKFVINTFLAFQSQNFQPDRNSPRTQAIAVAVYSEMEIKQLSLDGVFHANNLVEHYIHRQREAYSLDFGAKADETCLAHELQVSENPVSTRVQFQEVVANTLQELFESATKITHADEIRLWLFDRYSDRFEQVAYCREAEGNAFQPELHALSPDHIVRYSMEKQKIVTLSHSDWIVSERETVNRYRDEANKQTKMEEINKLSAERETYHDSSQSSGAAFAVPIYKGMSPVGVLEITAEAVGRLDLHAPLFERLGKICGDIARRLELANDRGWLLRMSFIHAARHRVEEILRDLENEAGEAASALLDLIQSGHRHGVFETAETADKGFQNARSRIQKALTTHGSREHVDDWLKRFTEIRNSIGMNMIVCDTVADIVETLASNAVHSKFDLACLDLFHFENLNGTVDVVVRYSPEDVMLSVSRLEQVTVSPIPDVQTPTYHYGLFLLSAQLRMLGGTAGVKQPLTDDGLGNTEFGLAFSVPNR